MYNFTLIIHQFLFFFSIKTRFFCLNVENLDNDQFLDLELECLMKIWNHKKTERCES